MTMRSRLLKALRKLPYYIRSLRSLLQIATLRSVARCVVSSDRQLDLRDGPLLLSTALDLLVVKETVVDDVYGLKTLEAADGLIVDVGAGIGEFALAAAKRFPHLDVYAFEPNPMTFRLLAQNTLSRQVSNVHAEQIAIGIQDTYVLRSPSAGPRASAAAPRMDNDAVVVPAKRLDDALPNSTVRLLKIDCEGLELDVLRSATRVLEAVDKVVVEYHRRLLRDADELVRNVLHNHGFRTRLRPDAYDDSLGYVDGWRQ